MKLRRFNDSGLNVFRDFLDSLTTDSPLPWPESALTDGEYSEEVEEIVEIEQRSFSSRFELAEYLNSAFEADQFKARADDKGLWAWIACFYFKSVCPKDRNGKHSPGALQRWIPQNGDWRRYYRHLFAGPWAIYRAHIDDPRRAMAVLCQQPGRPGDVVEQLVSRQEIVTSRALMAIATEIFVDPQTGRLRKGAGGKGAGSARRFVTVAEQFDVTWDFSVIGEDRLRQLFPQEFHSGVVS